MKTPPSKERAESRVVNRYRKLCKPLIELVDALQDLEPGGMLVDHIAISKSEHDNKIHIEYATHPVVLTIQDGNKRFTLQIADSSK